MSGETSSKYLLWNDAIASRFREHLQTVVRLYTLREWAYGRLPVLALAWAERAETVATFESLERVAEKRLASLALLPPLTAEMGSEPAAQVCLAVSSLRTPLGATLRSSRAVRSER